MTSIYADESDDNMMQAVQARSPGLQMPSSRYPANLSTWPRQESQPQCGWGSQCKSNAVGVCPELPVRSAIIWICFQIGSEIQHSYGAQSTRTDFSSTEGSQFRRGELLGLAIWNSLLMSQ